MTKTLPLNPEKPYPGFPLFPHCSGQWAKKIRGKTHYFGREADAALNKYLEQRDDLQAGRTPRDKTGELTLRQLANRFLNSKRLQMEAGELSARTWNDYYNTCESMTEFFGKDRSVLDLRPEDFDRYRADLAKTRGPVSIGNSILRTRIVCKWAYDNELLDRPVRFGTGFRRPSKKTMRKEKHARGSKLFTADEIRGLLDAAKGQLRAMILLGMNCGFGQGDIAEMKLGAIDLAGGWATYPRPKTGIMRRIPLWPETVKALTDVIASRATPRDAADAELVFLTIQGRRWIRQGKAVDKDSIYFNDYVATEFDKLLRKLSMKRTGLGFYGLRHTFRTVGDAAKDQPAIDLIMGHTRGDMAEEYRERIDDDRLQAVVNVVHVWLWPPLKRQQRKRQRQTAG